MKKAADFLREHRPSIIDAWEQAVAEEIPVSSKTCPMVLRNILPDLLGKMAEVIDRQAGKQTDLKDEKCEEILKESIDHGRSRATSSQYTIEQMMKEYIILQRIITDKLLAADLFSIKVSIVLCYIIETSMLYAIGAFSNSLQDMREKLVGTLAHDIRNPIAAAFLSIEMMDYKDGENRIMKLRQMGCKSLQRSLHLIEGLLDAITIKAGEGITLNFHEGNILHDIKYMYREASEIFSGLIVLEAPEKEIQCIYDGTVVRRVLENLLTNAIKYGSRDKPITLCVKDKENEVLIEVHNHGNPIPAENQENIFNFLNRSHKDAGGLKSWGMGLSFVKMAAQAHGGQVSVESDPEKGTSFFFSINKFLNKPGKVRSRLH